MGRRVSRNLSHPPSSFGQDLASPSFLLPPFDFPGILGLSAESGEARARREICEICLPVRHRTCLRRERDRQAQTGVICG